jgi:hypothetical protein
MGIVSSSGFSDVTPKMSLRRTANMRLAESGSSVRPALAIGGTGVERYAQADNHAFGVNSQSPKTHRRSHRLFISWS